ALAEQPVAHLTPTLAPPLRSTSTPSIPRRPGRVAGSFLCHSIRTTYMTQRDIDRAVARATGETVGRVHQMGFTLVVIPPPPLARSRPAGNHRSRVRTSVNHRPFAARYEAQT